MISEDDPPNMETDPPDKFIEHKPHRTKTNAVNRKAPKRKPPDPPPKIPDLDRCRQHKEIQKDIKTMSSCLTFLEHCINSEKEFPDLTDDGNLVGYQKDYDDLASLKE
ncbi:hypothetical protein TNCV_2072221 [Trichonephila clavipes]|nr:hypothetical protein TNCV_2072221 [Trichonephila clavipes]